ncbi:Annexin A1 isoform p37 [Lachnellula willkommii]|uniref:Annexin A1 isoform p37 n=1 Tax=Lachnellula willkommii TaxID=215461 RepID=A0A559M4T3_9HELO|nr:Annexin A1 isoform p37 [Lachnellula willkommii]
MGLLVLEYCAGEAGKSTDEGQDDSAPRPFGDFLEDISEDETGEEQESDIDLLLDSIRDPIDRLFKVSTRIRNPSSRLGSSKALRHQQFDQDSGIDLLRAVEDFDYDHISSLFLQYRKSRALEEHETVEPSEDADGKDEANHVWEPFRTVLSQYQNDLSNGTESFLVRRITRANVRRRQQFAYWKQHRDKLAQHTKSFTLNIETREQATPIVVDLQKQGNMLVIPGMAIADSVTTASRLNIPQLVDRDDRSTVSVSEYAPSMWKPGREAVDFPAAPKQDSDEKFFECPYCFTLCSTEILAEKAWKAHIIHDLRPYICTYDDCRNPDQLYDSRQDWIQHENSHRRIWRCPEHPAHTSTYLDEYRDHLHKEHVDYNDETLRSSLIHAAETTLPSSDRCCPICSLQLETARSLHSHIGLHLERFSLFSLPRSIDQANEDSNDGVSDKANTAFEGSRNEDFDSDVDVEGEHDQTTSAAGVARGRWMMAIRAIKTKRLARSLLVGHRGDSASLELSQDRPRLHDPEEDAVAIAKALMEKPADTKPLIAILPRLSHEQVLDLRIKYKRWTSSVAKHITMILGTDTAFGKIAYVTALGRWESEAYWANFGYQGEKGRRELLIESLMGRTNREIREIKDVFLDKKYGDSLTKCIEIELKDGRFKKAVLLVLEEKRGEEGPEYPLDRVLIEDDTRHLYEAVTSEKGYESLVISIVVVRSDSHLREVLRLYEATYKANFAREILKKSANLVGELLAHILNGVINKPARDALLVHHALSLSESDSTRTDLLVSRLVRYHWDRPYMGAVKREYRNRYEVDMQKAVAEGIRGELAQFCEMLCIPQLV